MTSLMSSPNNRSPHSRTPDKPLALITGGNGFLGSHLAEKLVGKGFGLRLLLRKKSDRANIRHLDYEEVIGDLRDRQSLIAAARDVDYIFHSAGLVKAPSLEAFLDANERGTANLLSAATESAPNLKRFVYISSQAAAGPADSHKPKTETDPPQPVSDYGRSKLAGEREVMKFADRLPVTIIRPPAVFGPRDTEVLEFFKNVKLGLLVKFGRAESFVSLVYVKDLVAGIVSAALSERAINETFYVNSVDELSQWQAQEMIAEVMKVTIKPLLVPLPLLRAAARIVSTVQRNRSGGPLISPDKVDELSRRWWISSSEKAKELLDFKPGNDLFDALRETYDWYCKQRWL